jgi:hypothetical protein
MKSTADSRARQSSAKAARTGRIHPVIIYPFKHRQDYSDLAALYELVTRLDADRKNYARPLTVMDRKTFFSAEHEKKFADFRKSVVARHSDILDAWCVDTCQMWYSGLGRAFELGAKGDIYWLIPGDFNYGTAAGQRVLSRLHDLPEIVAELDQDICVGEIATDQGNSKHLIDTYGTFALLYNWFPAEAQKIREMTERPRSEFFALRHDFLQQVMKDRWFAYEQTVVMLVKAAADGKKISRFLVGEISDLLEGPETFASATTQVERIERVLKTLWRERHQAGSEWTEEYHTLDVHSEQIRRTALTILRNLLG